MDIAKYVGLFLLKNEYCYLPGIGSLQIIKRTANFNKETLNTEAPGYEVVFVKGSGSIDDTFANFIANNERISIAQAANHLKDFCAYSKAELVEGRDILIHGVGKFVGKNNGNDIFFETDPSLRIQGKQIPYFKISNAVVEKKNEDKIATIIEQTNFKQPKADEEIVIKPAQINWGKIAILSVIVLAVLGFIIYLIANRGDGTPEVVEQKQEEVIQQAPEEEIDAPVNTDTDVPNSNTSTPAVAPTSDGSLRVVINSYDNKERADARAKKLSSYGHNASVFNVPNDSLAYKVIVTVPTPNPDKQVTVDSLKKLLNPRGNVYAL